MKDMRWINRLTLLAVLCTSACGIVEPCQVGRDINMDGNWQLTLVNGQPIPPNGVGIPGTSNRLFDGDLFFKTYTYSKCDSDVGRVTSGALVAHYQYLDLYGEAAGGTGQGAKFIYDNGSGDVTITAGAYSANGTRFGNEFTIQQEFAGYPYTLTFQQLTYK